MKIPDKLKSRKFQAFLAALFLSLGGLLSGELDIDKALLAVVLAGISYMQIEGRVDAARAGK